VISHHVNASLPGSALLSKYLFMPLGFGATGGENILQQMCHFQGFNRGDSTACLWGRCVQFKSYISEMLQMNDI